jgi:hypothetical protein
MSWIWRLPLGLIGLWIAILGLHGLYIHFNWLNLIFSSKGAGTLFMVVDLPIDFLSDQVAWMTNSSLQSWVLPGVIFAAGAFLAYKFLLNKFLLNK